MIKATPNGGGDLGKIKILIADDHAVVRDSTRQLLEKETDLTVVAEACNGKKASALLSSSFCRYYRCLIGC